MRPRVLIVDDHVDIRHLVSMTLEFEDCELHEAADGDEALRLALGLRPAVILLDVMMPGTRDGLGVCRAVRAAETLTGTRILLLTARGGAQDRAAGLAAGADDVLVKPFSPLELIERVRRLLP